MKNKMNVCRKCKQTLPLCLFGVKITPKGRVKTASLCVFCEARSASMGHRAWRNKADRLTDFLRESYQQRQHDPDQYRVAKSQFLRLLAVRARMTGRLSEGSADQ